MTPIERKGETYIVILFGLALLLSIVIIVTFNLQIGPDNIIPQILRTLFTGLMMAITFSGFRWAKWILVAMYVFGAVTLSLKIWESEYRAEVYMNGFLFNFYLIFLYFILFSKPINAFLEYQEKNRSN
jgi:hypothetical protein